MDLNFENGKMLQHTRPSEPSKYSRPTANSNPDCGIVVQVHQMQTFLFFGQDDLLLPASSWKVYACNLVHRVRRSNELSATIA